MMERTLHIGVDATSWQNNRGFGRFTRELVTALASRNTSFRYTLLFDQAPAEGLPANVGILSAKTQKTLNESAVGTTSRSAGYLWQLGKLARQARFDVFFFPSVYSYFPILARVPCVVCYHDTTAERFPELVFPTALNRHLWRIKATMARWQATRAMTVSKASAKDLVDILHIPAGRIDLVTEGADPVFRMISDPGVAVRARRAYGVPADAELLVYVGGINPHKNLLGLLKALPAVLTERPKVHLVIVGDTSGKGFWDNVEEVRRFVEDHPPLNKHVHFTGYISDSQLTELLNSTTALVFPSLWEGFGLPAVEAMSCGVPVLASNRSSLPEVIGDCGLFFDPKDPADIARCILKFLSDAELQRRLRALTLERVRDFTWERAAELAEACFRRCV